MIYKFCAIYLKACYLKYVILLCKCIQMLQFYFSSCGEALFSHLMSDKLMNIKLPLDIYWSEKLFVCSH